MYLVAVGCVLGALTRSPGRWAEAGVYRVAGRSVERCALSSVVASRSHPSVACGADIVRSRRRFVASQASDDAFTALVPTEMSRNPSKRRLAGVDLTGPVRGVRL